MRIRNWRYSEYVNLGVKKKGRERERERGGEMRLRELKKTWLVSP